MLSETKLKKFKIYQKKHTFHNNNHYQNIFPVSPKFPLCYSKIPCIFPVWKK